MIYAYLGDFDIFFKSDKNSKEVPSFFEDKDIYGFRLHRKIDTEKGVYHSAHVYFEDKREHFIKNYCQEIEILSENEFIKKCKEIHVQKPPTNEVEIRKAVKKYLEKEYQIVHLQDEYTHTSLPVRADLFAVTKDRKVITVEIKSDRDTFVRLRKQLEEYVKFSHIVYLAIDISHLAKFKKNFPNYYGGILIYEDGVLERYNACYPSESIDASSLLWKQEWLLFTKYFKGSFRGYGICELVKKLESVFTVKEYRSICEYLFVNRYLKEKTDFRELFSDLKYKQEKLQQ